MSRATSSAGVSGRNANRFIVIEFTQIVFHDGPRQTLSRIDARNIKIAKRCEAILAAVVTFNVFVTTGWTVHNSGQKSDIRSQSFENAVMLKA